MGKESLNYSFKEKNKLYKICEGKRRVCSYIFLTDSMSNPYDIYISLDVI